MSNLFRKLWSRTTLSLLCLGAILAIFIPFRSSAISKTQTDRSVAWTLADIRLLEQPNLNDPAFDLFAAATRTLDTDLQIRLELLDSQSAPDYDLYLAIDSAPGGVTALPVQASAGIKWDYLLAFPLDGAPTVTTSDGGSVSSFRPRIARDPYQDTITISINKSSFPGDPQRFTFQAFVTLSGQAAPIDSLGPVNSQDWTYQSAPLLLAFWDTLPANTPAQTLRRWDGAHTGPNGSRNGLKYLLQAAENYQLPIALLDIKTPETLSGLDYIGGTELFRQLLRDDLLILPDVQEIGLPPSAVAYTESIDQAFGLTTSQIIYASNDPRAIRNHQVAFAHLTDPSHVFASTNIKLIPLPADSGSGFTAQINETETESTDSSLSLDVRRQLISAALSADPGDLIVLGGSLSETTWGDVTVSGPVFSYLANHPWIHVLDEGEIIQFPASSEQNALACADLLCIQNSGAGTGIESSLSDPAVDPAAEDLAGNLLAALEKAPAGNITDLAWRMFANLTSATTNGQLSALRDTYLGQVQSLILAAEWADNPGEIATCSIDADLNGSLDCILASDTLFAVFQPQGGRLVFAFYRDDRGAEQWIGPASQFSVGISDPSTWDISLGPLADPNEIPGAFTELEDPLRAYQPSITPGQMVFTAADGTQKSYSLSGDSLHFEYIGITPVQFQIPLVVAPETRYSEGWVTQYFSEGSSDQWTWGLASGLSISLRTDASFETSTFKDSFSLTRNPEDPNQDYPLGHYLPFPLALMTIEAENQVTVDLTIQ